MLVRKIPLVTHLRRKATASAAFTAKLPAFRKEDIIVIDGVSCMNDTRNNSWCSVGICRGNTNYYYETLDMKEGDKYYTTSHPVTITGDDRIVLKFEEHAEGDTFQVLITAHIEVYDAYPDG